MGNWASSVVVVLLVPLPSSVRESLKDHWLVGNMASNSGNCTNVFIYKHVDAPGCAWYPLSLHGSLYMQRMHAQEGARRPSARLSWRSVWTKCKGGGKCTDLELERRCWGPSGRLLPLSFFLASNSKMLFFHTCLCSALMLLQRCVCTFGLWFVTAGA